ncbi:MAG TPA: methylmalonyl-CoA mutase family protein [Candidatus Methylomirabilis sp.]|nr:methylmalonyl-CoA mutase family protein [Candidatus Methylomirabilis sp.]
MSDLDAAKLRWEEQTLGPVLKKTGERQDEFHTRSGIPVERVYLPSDGEVAFVERLGFPGEYPYTRGIYPTMYRGQLWTIRQYAGAGTAEESNRRFRFLLGQGQTGLSVAFDLPTQLGLDSDAPEAEGEVGQVGVAIDSLRDMEMLFEEIPLEKVSTSMTINAPAAVLVAMYIAVGETQGLPSTVLAGTVQNDVLKEYVARGTYIFPPRPSLRLAGDLIAHCAEHVPKFNPISISGYHMREAGATAIQEMAFTFANAAAYIREVTARGIPVDRFAPRISWIFNTHSDFFEEVAKYRALRRFWARLMREKFGATDPRSWMFRTHTQTGGSTLTAQQPENNIVRAALQALAAVLGGVQSLALSCFDEALALPTEAAQRLAVRTQQIIAHESGVTETVDPLAGSYLVETLTDELERRAEELFNEVETLGGAVAAIERGVMQKAIQEEAYRFQCEVEKGRRIVVGVNAFSEETASPSPPLFRVNAEVADRQRDRLKAVRREREPGAVTRTLAALRDAAEGDGNLMPPILAAVKAYATIGEICGVLRDVFGTYHALDGL